MEGSWKRVEGKREKEGSEKMYSSIKTIENNRKHQKTRQAQIKLKLKRETELGLPRFMVIRSEKPSKKRRGTSRN